MKQCRFALILDKLGCASETKNKKFIFDFEFLSACTNFACYFKNEILWQLE